MCCGVENTPKWVGTAGQHGTESRTSSDLEVVCYEAVLSRGRGTGIHTSYQYIRYNRWDVRPTRSMVILVLLHGHTITTLLPHYYYTITTLLRHYFHTITTLLPHYYHTNTTLLPHYYHTITTLLPHYYGDPLILWWDQINSIKGGRVRSFFGFAIRKCYGAWSTLFGRSQECSTRRTRERGWTAEGFSFLMFCFPFVLCLILWYTINNGSSISVFAARYNLNRRFRGRY